METSGCSYDAVNETFNWFMHYLKVGPTSVMNAAAFVTVVFVIFCKASNKVVLNT